GEEARSAFDVGRFGRHIVEMNRLPRRGDTAQAGSRTRPLRPALPDLGECRRHAKHGTRPPRAALEAEQHAEAGFAEAHGVRQHGLEHWLQLAGRTRNYLQHLRRSCLLLQRLAQLALARFELLFQLVSVCLEVLLRPSLGLAATGGARSRLRSGRTKLAAACWAFCAFERQGHLVGTVTGLLPRPS